MTKHSSTLNRRLAILNTLKNKPLTFKELQTITGTGRNITNLDLIHLQRHNLVRTFGPKRLRLYLLKNEGLVYLSKIRLYNEAQLFNDVADLLFGGSLNE